MALLANNDKVPYTDAGIQLVRAGRRVLAGIGHHRRSGAALVDPAPAVANVDPNDKAIRLLRDVRFQFVLQGAINKVMINGTVLVAAGEAMSQMRAWNIRDLAISLNAVPLSDGGYGEDEVMQLEWEEDQFMPYVGADGEVARGDEQRPCARDADVCAHGGCQ